jgi:hypothetical protein
MYEVGNNEPMNVEIGCDEYSRPKLGSHVTNIII